MVSPSRLRKLALGLAVAIVVLLGVEGAARAAFGPPPPSDLLKRAANCEIRGAEGRTWMECGLERELAYEGLAKKTRPRVVVLGGSSVRDPFKPVPGDDFPDRLQARLPEVEVLNLGRAGMSLAGVAYLSSRLAALAPDLVVIYEGHNDYAEHTFRSPPRSVRLWLLPIERALAWSWIYGALHRATPVAPPTRPKAAGPVCAGRGGSGRILAAPDDAAIRRSPALTAQLTDDLRTAIRSSPAPVVVSTLLRNFDNPPMAEVAPAGSTCAQALACLGDDGSVPFDAIAAFATEACGEGAVAWYYRARAADQVGDKAKATEAFRRSLALDAAPLRAPYAADEAIRKVAAEEGATLLDLEAVAGPLPDGRYFRDTLHPSEAGMDLIAGALEPVVRRKLGLAASAPGSAAARR